MAHLLGINPKKVAYLPNRKVNPEFDHLADEYEALLKQAITLSGDEPDYFAEYKIADLAQHLQSQLTTPQSVLDFGSGIGNSIPFFRKYFSGARLSNADVSLKSIEVAKARFPGSEQYLQISDCIPLPDSSQDLVFSACVFHHIPPAEHVFWLQEIKRVLKPGGFLALYEHNPVNPLTKWAVRNSPLDVNAILIAPSTLKKLVQDLDFGDSNVAYKVFFPKFLSSLRKYELHLEGLPFGAQYRLVANKSKT